MAVIKKDGGNMALPIAIKRGNPIALDTTSVWYNKTEMETYAASGATAYVGQSVVFVDEENSTVEAYVIANATGTLVKLASTTASGDVVADITKLQGDVAKLEKALEDVKKTADDNAKTIALILDDPSTEAIDSIKELTKYVEEDGKTTAGLVSRLAGIGGEGEPATVLEAIQQAEYKLTVATTEKLGGVKSAAADKENAVQVGADGVMSIAKITTDILAQGTQELILNGGSATL